MCSTYSINMTIIFEGLQCTAFLCCLNICVIHIRSNPSVRDSAWMISILNLPGFVPYKITCVTLNHYTKAILYILTRFILAFSEVYEIQILKDFGEYLLLTCDRDLYIHNEGTRQNEGNNVITRNYVLRQMRDVIIGPVDSIIPFFSSLSHF